MDIFLSQHLWDDEVALLVAASGDAAIADETYLPPGMSESQAKRWFFGQKWAYFIVCDEEPVGMVVFHPKPGKVGVVEVETWLLEAHRRRGISAAAHPVIVEEAKKRWNTLTAWVWGTNDASLGLLRHTGFVKTGKQYEMGGRVCTELRLKLSD